MKMSVVIPVIKAVLLNPFVIGATCAIILYCNFLSYVSRYKKKPPKPKKKIVAEEAAPAPKQEGENGEGSEEQQEQE
ncbi:MAG: hypothetical protein J6Y36_01260 [Treponema sp.]|uniref:hypothetical protein n=1 Tax=Treponema sp. TaxID=166 RepID=UPI001B6EAA7B|nr:hypothetical protein [Treponema sp.]MBP5401764.1 hypothetical protein [Treponema sp.]MBR5932565.1 hypothetical protein [Treponema sp.]